MVKRPQSSEEEIDSSESDSENVKSKGPLRFEIDETPAEKKLRYFYLFLVKTNKNVERVCPSVWIYMTSKHPCPLNVKLFLVLRFFLNTHKRLDENRKNEIFRIKLHIEAHCL